MLVREAHCDASVSQIRFRPAAPKLKTLNLDFSWGGSDF